MELTGKYFGQVLTQWYYYLGQEINGRWQGKVADRLVVGHGKFVSKKQFLTFLEGEHNNCEQKASHPVHGIPDVHLYVNVLASLELTTPVFAMQVRKNEAR